jgi:6-phosphofructo-2-kinase/fructose-2,6-biphosphatase 2
MLSCNGRIFNVGQYRREKLGAIQPHNFFDPSNEITNNARTEVAMAALDDMLKWLDHFAKIQSDDATTPNVGEGIMNMFRLERNPSIIARGDKREGAVVGRFTVAIYDATNSTKERREAIFKKCKAHNVPMVFIESLCDDEGLIKSNIVEVKLSSPDYVGIDAEAAISDFQERIKHYSSTYDTLTRDEMNGQLPFVKLINVGQEVIVHKVFNFKSTLGSRIFRVSYSIFFNESQYYASINIFL